MRSPSNRRYDITGTDHLRPTYGHMVELYERSDRLRDFYGMVARAAEGWTGDEPVRMLASGSRGRSRVQ